MTEVLGYHAMRMRQAQVLLLGFLRRWGAYAVVAAAVLGAGTNSPWQIIEGAAAAVVLPLFQAAATPLWLACATAVYALAGTLPVLLTRPLWWPRRWRLAERALPLTAGVLRRSDLRLLPWLLAPWLGLQLLGVAALWRHDPPELHAARGLALAAWGVSAGASAALVLQWMQWLRHRHRGRRAAGPTPRIGATGKSDISGRLQRGAGVADLPATARGLIFWHARRWTWALVWTPLWRGPAQRAGRLLALALLLQAGFCGLLAWQPSAVGWWLGGLTLVALAGASALRVRLHQDLAPLWQAARTLPLAPTHGPRAATALALLPCALGLLLAAAALPWPQLRVGVAATWGALLLLACRLEGGRPPTEPSHHAARWLFALALLLALGFEVPSA